jgi:hypothetical protein
MSSRQVARDAVDGETGRWFMTQYSGCELRRQDVGHQRHQRTDLEPDLSINATIRNFTGLTETWFLRDVTSKRAYKGKARRKALKHGPGHVQVNVVGFRTLLQEQVDSVGRPYPTVKRMIGWEDRDG